jgi:signal transduction histidine kinase
MIPSTHIMFDRQFVWLMILFLIMISGEAHPRAKLSTVVDDPPEVYSYFLPTDLEEPLKSHGRAKSQSRCIDLVKSGISAIVSGNVEDGKSLLEEARILSGKEGLTRIESVCLNEIGMYYYNLGEYDRALGYFNQAMAKASRTKYHFSMGMSLNNMGKFHHSRGNFNESLAYFNKAEEHLVLAGTQVGRAIVLNNIGKHHDTRGEYHEALRIYTQVLQLLDSSSNILAYSSTCNHIGTLYLAIGNKQMALDFHTKALEARRTAGYLEGQGKSLKNIGNVHEEMGQLDSAMYYYRLAYKIFSRVGYKKGIVKCFTSMGRVESANGDTRSAYYHYQEAFALATQLGYEKGICHALMSMGQFALNEGKYTEALDYATRGLNLAEKGNISDVRETGYYISYKALSNQGSYKESLEALEKYHAHQVEILATEKNRKIAELQVAHETEQKKRENELLKRDIQIKELQLGRSQGIIGWIGSILILSTISLGLLWILFKRKHQLNQQLQDFNDRVNQQNTSLEKLNEDLHVAMEERDKFFGIIAHELRNPLWWFKNITEILSVSFESMSREQMRKSLQSLDESAKQSFLLIDNLLQWSRSKVGKVKYSPVDFHMKLAIDDTAQLFRSIAQYKNIQFSTIVSSEMKAYGDIDLVKTVLRNLLSNAFKFTPPGGHIEVAGRILENEIEIMIRDSGIGIDESNMDKLFREDTSFTTLGLYQEKGSGIGLALCKEFVSLHGGRICHERTVEGYTEFKFTIPLAAGDNPIVKEKLLEISL